MADLVQKTLQNGAEMNERETMQSFCNGLRKAASCARELGALLEDPSWGQTAEMLDGMRVNGTKLSQMRSMSKMEVDTALNLKTRPIIGSTH